MLSKLVMCWEGEEGGEVTVNSVREEGGTELMGSSVGTGSIGSCGGRGEGEGEGEGNGEEVYKKWSYTVHCTCTCKTTQQRF